jgi:hypothetical protein
VSVRERNGSSPAASLPWRVSGLVVAIYERAKVKLGSFGLVVGCVCCGCSWEGCDEHKTGAGLEVSR